MSAARRGGARAVAIGAALVVVLLGAAGWLLVVRDGVAPIARPAASGSADAARERPLAPPAPDDGPVAVREVADGATADAGAARDAPAADSPPVELHAIALHVVDARSGAELRGVELRWRADDGQAFGPRELPPADSFAPLARGDSPLAPPPPAKARGLGRIVAQVDGYALAMVEVDWRAGGERTLELEPGGTLELHVTGAASSPPLAARLYDVDALAEKLSRTIRLLQRARAADSASRMRALELVGATLGALRLGTIDDPDAGVLGKLLRGRPSRYVDLDADGRARVEALRPGRWLVRVADPGQRVESSVAWSDFEVRAGDVVRLDLEARALRDAPRVAAAGTVRFDRGWFADGMPPLPTRLQLQPLSGPDVASFGARGVAVALTAGASFDARAFEAGPLPPGTLAARLDEWSFATTIELAEEGDTKLEIEVPPPADVTVAVRGLDGTKPAPGAFVQWRAFVEPLLGDLAHVERRAATADGEGLVHLVVPAGHLEIACSSSRDESGLFLEEHVVKPGHSLIDARAAVAARVAVTLRDGAAIVPWNDAIAFEVVGAVGPLAQLGAVRASGEAAVTLLVDGDGQARLIVVEAEGYRPPEPVDVELGRGATAAVTIALERRRS